jgi:hypothetical protein
MLKHTSPTGKERHYDSFLAGLLGGYTVFGRTIHNSVSQQIVIYVAARVCLALAKLAVQQRHVGGGGAGVGVQGAGGGFELFGNGELRRSLVKNGWPAFASLSWAMVMYIFRWHPESVQSSLRSSMSYMWVFCVSWDGMTANKVAVMYSRIIGIRSGRWCGITNKRLDRSNLHTVSSRYDFSEASLAREVGAALCCPFMRFESLEYQVMKHWKAREGSLVSELRCEMADVTPAQRHDPAHLPVHRKEAQCIPFYEQNNDFLLPPPSCADGTLTSTIFCIENSQTGTYYSTSIMRQAVTIHFSILYEHMIQDSI